MHVLDRAATLLLVLFAAPLGAQDASVLQARVTDLASRRPLAGVEVLVAVHQREARTDSAGIAVLRELPAGPAEVEVRALGYLPARAELVLSGRDTLEVLVALERAPLGMDTVRVAAAAVPLGLEVFDRRRRGSVGHFLDAATIEREQDRELATVVASSVPGVRAVTGTDGISRYLVATRRRAQDALSGKPSEDSRRTQGRLPPGACVMHVYVDGVFLSDYDVSGIETRSIAAIEVYGGSVPPELRRAGSDCGVVVLWTRRTASP
ncbi:MAG TPA: carboxypeptidase regulatory-like domain-containing protein [Gemmatimonadales bacterium]